MLIPQDQRDPALRALAGVDPLDVLSAIAGLQLLPENADALFRLESAAGVASAMVPADDGGAISDAAAIAWVNRPVFGAVADPFDNSFTDEFLFHYGSFRARSSRPAARLDPPVPPSRLGRELEEAQRAGAVRLWGGEAARARHQGPDEAPARPALRRRSGEAKLHKGGAPPPSPFDDIDW